MSEVQIRQPRIEKAAKSLERPRPHLGCGAIDHDNDDNDDLSYVTHTTTHTYTNLPKLYTYNVL
jgi:hypothetical protein